MALQALPTMPPIPPNFHICNEHYGTGLKFGDCTTAGQNLGQSSNLIYYHEGDLPGPPYLIWSYTFGGCTIRVEKVGPNVQGHIEIRPSDVRGAAGWVIKQCVTASALGGFATVSFENMVNYVTDPFTHFGERFPPSSSFFTVTVSGPLNEVNEYRPGEQDPAVPEALSDALRGVASSMRPGNPYATRYLDGSILFMAEAYALDRSSGGSWWKDMEGAPVRRIHMVYECDAKLGTPASADCSQLEYSQLGPPSDVITVGPGLDKVLSLKTCHVGISASAKLILTWDQIRVAVDRLINQCVLHPLKPAIGGRAYYGVQPLQSVHGRRGQKRDTLNGLNALPPHANITLY